MDQPRLIQIPGRSGSPGAPPAWHIFTTMYWVPRHIACVAFKLGSGTIHPNDLLKYHRDRLLEAALAFRFTHAVEFLRGNGGLERLEKLVDDHLDSHADCTNTAWRIKITFTPNGNHKIEHLALHTDLSSSKFARQPGDCAASGVTESGNPDGSSPFAPETLLPRDLAWPLEGSCTVTIDAQTTAFGPFTRHKTTNRWMYDAARARARPPLTDKTLPTVAEVLLVNAQNQIVEATMSTPYFLRNGQWITPHVECGGNNGVTRRLAMENGLCKEGIVNVDEVTNGELIWLSNALRGFWKALIKVSVLDDVHGSNLIHHDGSYYLG